MSTLGNKHPEYVDHEEDWRLCRDCFQGERRIKEQGSRYLPPTAGMYMDGYPNIGTKGTHDYNGYRDRAVFHNFLKKSVLHYMGLLHHKEATIELPQRMEPLREKCTRHGETLLQLLRVIHEELLVTGRLGLYGSMPDTKTTDVLMPYISFYRAESILNWDEGETDQVDEDSLNMLVLDESGPRRKDTFGWDLQIKQYRVLLLGDPFINEQNAGVVSANADRSMLFQDGLFAGDQEFDPALMDIPNIRGVALGRIPFVIINSKDTQPRPDDPPQLDLANQDITIYKGEADYRQALHMQAQPTLCLMGYGSSEESQDGSVDQPIRTGVGAVIRIPNPAGDAKYVGVDPTGIPEMRQGLENDVRTAQMMSGSLTDTRTNQKESGDAMGKRMAAESARLINIAQTAAVGLQSLLRIIAEWMGEDPLKVVVTPNKEFSFKPLTPADMNQLQAFKTAGGPISDESIHTNLVRSGLTDLDYEDEQVKMGEEEPRIDLTGAPVNAPLNKVQQQAFDHADERMEMERNGDEE